jgi:hypothetical protein
VTELTAQSELGNAHRRLAIAAIAGRADQRAGDVTWRRRRRRGSVPPATLPPAGGAAGGTPGDGTPRVPAGTIVRFSGASDARKNANQIYDVCGRGEA